MGGLTPAQLGEFEEKGYLVIEGVLADKDLAGLQSEYADILDAVAPSLVAAQKLSDTHSGLPFGRRYSLMLAELDDMYDLYQHLDICLPLVEDMPPDATMNTGTAAFELLTHPRLLDIVESVIGPEIYSNPVQHARIKPPASLLPGGATDANVAATMWHQDQAVLDRDAAATDMLTVWVAVTSATEENGCLLVVPGSHRHPEALHCPGKVFPAEIYIPDDLIDSDTVTPVPVGAGGVVLLHRLTQHGSLDNRTDEIRWSFDLRYHPVGQPTGRPYFPGFVARSSADPASVLTDPARWAALWMEARDRVAAGEAKLALSSLWDQYAGRPVCA